MNTTPGTSLNDRMQKFNNPSVKQGPTPSTNPNTYTYKKSQSEYPARQSQPKKVEEGLEQIPENGNENNRGTVEEEKNPIEQQPKPNVEDSSNVSFKKLIPKVCIFLFSIDWYGETTSKIEENYVKKTRGNEF